MRPGAFLGLGARGLPIDGMGLIDGRVGGAVAGWLGWIARRAKAACQASPPHHHLTRAAHRRAESNRIDRLPHAHTH